MLNANILIEVEQGSEAWRAARKQGIGGSDAAAALGLDEYRTPLELYKEKLNLVPEFTGNFFTRRGQAMEPVLREEFKNKTGRESVVVNAILQHPEYKFMLSSLDGYSNDNRLQEYKTASSSRGWGEEGTDQIPQKYLIQVQHNLIVTGYEVADVLVSVAGGEPRLYEIPADKEVQQMIIDGEHDFWQKVTSQTEPDPTSIAELQKKFTISEGVPIAATPELETAVNKLFEGKQLVKEIEAESDSMKETIQKYLLLAGASVLFSADGNRKLCTWNEQKGRTTIDAKALQANFPDVYAQVSKAGNPFRVLLIK